MDEALKDLIQFVKDGDLGFVEIAVYSGQIKTGKSDLKIIEVSGKLPNCLHIVGPSRPVASPPHFEFDQFICTQSVTFQSDENTDANIALVNELVDYYETNNTFEGENSEYQIDLDLISVLPFLVNDKYAIYIVHIAIDRLT